MYPKSHKISTSSCGRLDALQEEEGAHLGDHEIGRVDYAAN